MNKRRTNSRKLGEPVSWLPIDSRLIPDIFAFGHVKGVARIFLIVEMTAATLVVIGTFIVVLLRALGL